MRRILFKLAKAAVYGMAGKKAGDGNPAGPKIYFFGAFKKYIDAYKKATLIANGARIGRVVFHGRWIFLGRAGHLSIGDEAHINEGVILQANDSLTIGDGAHLSAYCQLYTSRLEPEASRRDVHSSKPIAIGRKAWLGANTIVLGGVTIGENAIIGAHSLVNRDIPPNVLAAGCPARVIRPVGGA